MSGSQFIVQTSKFLLINATDVTLGQGHGKVIQYIFPDLYFLCPKYVRVSWNTFRHEKQKLLQTLQWQMRKRTEYIVTPDQGDLINHQ